MKSRTVGAFEAKTHFSALLEKVRHGAVFTVTLRGKPVAEIGPAKDSGSRPVFGSAKGRVRMRDDFDDPLADMAEYER